MEEWIKRKCSNLTGPIGRPAKLEPFTIDTSDENPIKIRPRPHSPLDLAKIKDFIDENLKSGVISETDSPWSAPLVLATKADSSTRVCVDYRALNQITRKDAHPLPCIDESFTQFNGARYFTMLDLKSGYWQILLDLASRQKTAFSSRYGHYVWNVLPFGLSNAPGAFQRRMNKVLARFIYKFVLLYIDGFANLPLPLTDLQKGSPAKRTAITWTKREEASFQALKKAITSEPVLKHPQIGKPFVIDPDSSQFVIGAVLQQLFMDPDGKERLHPIAFESKKLTETEQRYPTQERELLAAKDALDHWRHIIVGSDIQIRTDHESLKVYRTKKHMTKRLTKFMQEIEHYDPLITYRPGHLQTVPDSISRMPGAREEGAQ